jgi:5-methylcytosine-specific restriction endonuclease McrA
LNKICEKILLIENREARQQSLKNKAAENTKTKRKIANGVKKNLADNDECPYCGCELTTFFHADHIYPVAKGGESTKRNMVLVCVDCNSKKSSLTLQAFIKKYNLNRDKIENRLEALGKDF